MSMTFKKARSECTLEPMQMGKFKHVWFILFLRQGARGLNVQDPLPYLCIMNFLFRCEVREQSQAKPNRLRILLNSKPVNPCTRGNLTFLHFYLSNGYGTGWISGIGDESGPEYKPPFKNNYSKPINIKG
jgi:hypothetical protein